MVNEWLAGLLIYARRSANPHVGAMLAASRADETRLDIGQPHVVRPPIAAHGDQVAALLVRAIDQRAAHAHVAHLGERDLRAGHASKAASAGRIGFSCDLSAFSAECGLPVSYA
jgi:hypothetical protein